MYDNNMQKKVFYNFKWSSEFRIENPRLYNTNLTDLII